MGRRYFDGDRPRIYGHRGSAGTAPENTLASFEEAVSAGAEVLELDVHATADGVVVVCHDPSVDRTTEGRGEIRRMSLVDLQSLDAGWRFGDDHVHPYRGRGLRIPTLEELIDALPDVPLNVEVKQSDPPIETAVVDLLRRKAAMDRTMLAAAEGRVLNRLRLAAPEAVSSSSKGEVTKFWLRFQTGRLEGYQHPGDALQIPPSVGPIRLARREIVDAAHGCGLEVHLWTINDEAEMRELLDLGVDAIMSDYPERARRVLDEWRQERAT